MKDILKVQLTYLQKLLDNKDITLSLSDAALDYLAEQGYSPEYGARPLKRVIQKQLQNKLANALLAGEFLDGSTIQVDMDENSELVFSNT